MTAAETQEMMTVMDAVNGNTILPSSAPLPLLNGAARAYTEHKQQEVAEAKASGIPATKSEKSTMQVVADRERRNALLIAYIHQSVHIKDQNHPYYDRTGVVYGVDSCPMAHHAASHPPEGDYLHIELDRTTRTYATEKQVQLVPNAT